MPVAASRCRTALPYSDAAPRCRTVLPHRVTAPHPRTASPHRVAAPRRRTHRRSTLPHWVTIPRCRTTLLLCIAALHFTALLGIVQSVSLVACAQGPEFTLVLLCLFQCLF